MSETYSEVKINDKVWYKEGRHIIKCEVQNITYRDNLKVFQLLDSDGCVFTVTVDKTNSSYCPWHFMDKADIQFYNSYKGTPL